MQRPRVGGSVPQTGLCVSRCFHIYDFSLCLVINTDETGSFTGWGWGVRKKHFCTNVFVFIFAQRWPILNKHGPGEFCWEIFNSLPRAQEKNCVSSVHWVISKELQIAP